MFSLIIRRGIHIQMSKSGSCILARHPEVSHPYEHTKPLPKVERDDHFLKQNSDNMFTKSPNLEQLQTLTYTHASYWHEYKGKEKRQKLIDYESTVAQRI